MDHHKIIERFPSFKEKIEYLIVHNGEFQDICEDYLLCHEEIVKMNEKFNQPLLKINEYHELLASLEQEMINYLMRS
jgi:hypothetical protein